MNMNLKEFWQALEYVESQLDSGYLDLGMHDDDENEIVKTALEEYRKNHGLVINPNLTHISDFQDFNYERIAFEIGYLRDSVKEMLKERLKHDYVNHLSRMGDANYFAIWNCDFQDFKYLHDIYFDSDKYDYKLARLFLKDGGWYYRVEEELEVCEKMRMM